MFGGTAKCATCGKSVYPNEQLAFEKKFYHAPCFVCSICNSTIVSTSKAGSMDGKVSHRLCFEKQMRTTGGKYGGEKVVAGGKSKAAEEDTKTPGRPSSVVIHPVEGPATPMSTGRFGTPVPFVPTAESAQMQAERKEAETNFLLDTDVGETKDDTKESDSKIGVFSKPLFDRAVGNLGGRGVEDFIWDVLLKRIKGKSLSGALTFIHLIRWKIEQSHRPIWGGYDRWPMVKAPQILEILERLSLALLSQSKGVDSQQAKVQLHSLISAGSARKTAVTSVVVIGAGISGIVAARELIALGIEVVLLEANDYVGGRLRTRGGLDLGAHWIHGGGHGPDRNSHLKESETNPVRVFCDTYGLETRFTDGNSCYTGMGKTSDLEMVDAENPTIRLSRSQLGELWNIVKIWKDHFDKYADTHFEQSSFPPYSAAIDGLLKDWTEVTGLPALTEWQQRCIWWHIDMEFQADIANDPEKCSLFFQDGVPGVGLQAYPGGDRILVEGYQNLAETLASKLDIRLNQRVTKIDYSGQGVTVHCGAAEFQADAVLVTVPLGVLKRKPDETSYIEFQPALPQRKQEAIERLSMGLLAKLFLVFADCFWNKRQYTWGIVNRLGRRKEHPVCVINLYASHLKPVLCILVGGSEGEKLEKRTQAENLAWIMPFLKKLFNDDYLPNPVQVVTSRWHDDPSSFGSYSMQGINTHGFDRAHLAEPVDGKVFFAGEATSSYRWGYVDGALTTGWREAAIISGTTALLDRLKEQETVRKQMLLSNLRNSASSMQVRAILERNAEHFLKPFAAKPELSPAEFIAMATSVIGSQQDMRGVTEFEINFCLTEVIKMMDTNQDGKISEEEFKAFLRMVQAADTIPEPEEE